MAQLDRHVGCGNSETERQLYEGSSRVEIQFFRRGEREPHNCSSQWAIVVKKPGSAEIVGHVPDDLA